MKPSAFESQTKPGLESEWRLYHFSFCSQEGDFGSTVHCQRREEEIHFRSWRWPALTAPFTLEMQTPSPSHTHTHTHTHTQSKLCPAECFSLLRFPSYLLTMSNSRRVCVVSFLTSQSRVGWRVHRRGVGRVRHGGARDVIGVSHVSDALREPKQEGNPNSGQCFFIFPSR